MTWVLAILIVVIIGAVVVVASGRGEGLPPAEVDLPRIGMPEGRPVTADDIANLRFNTTVRGYRMEEVDEVLRRIAGQLDHRDRPSGPGADASSDR